MVTENLEPKAVFSWFERLCAIPHGSGNTKGISDFCANFAAERGLEYVQDALNNIVIFSPASPGYESAETMILQGHIDMVCAAAPGVQKDFLHEGLSLFVDGDLLGAKDTTLGGDDGIAVAMALAILDCPEIPHPRLEVIFTVEEETGMDGAMGLDPSRITGRRMLNLDSEDEGIFTVACAGGGRVKLSWQAKRESVKALPLRLTVSGLQGGHSGVEINKGRGNANILLGRVLRELSKCCRLRLISLSGGTADNAIPFSAWAQAAVGPEDADAVLAVTEQLSDIFAREFAYGDPGVTVSAALEAETQCSALAPSLTQQVIQALTLVPNGVQAISHDIPGLPESSLNLGMMTTTEADIALTFSVRSSVSSRKAKLIDRLRCVAEVCGANFALSGDYPAWEYVSDSPLRERMVRIYREMYGCAPQVLAIHAGLECGILSEKLPGLDCVSFGPDIPNIHTAEERLVISSVRRTWEFLLEVLKQSK